MKTARFWMLTVVLGVSILSNANAQEFPGIPAGHSRLHHQLEAGFESPDDSTSVDRERIETERHDFTQSTTTVGNGVRQIEAGYSYFQRSDDGMTEDSHTGPELMLRFGLRENLEFRIRYNEVWQFGEEHRSGSEDLRLSFKFRARDQSGWVPECAIEVRASTPTGGHDWSTDELEFGFDTIYGWQLERRVELNGSTGFSTNGLGDFGLAPLLPAHEEFMIFTQSLALGIELNEKSTIYLEFFGLFTEGLEDDNERPVFCNFGLDYYLSNDLVVDVRAGTGLNHDAEDLFFGIGSGFRF